VENLNYNQDYYAFTRIKTSQDFDNQVRIRLYKNKKLIDEQLNTVVPDSGLVTILYQLPTEKLTEDSYRLEIEAAGISEKRNFNIVWFRKPTYLYEYELAFRPMRYLFTETQYEEISDLPRADFKEWFEQYWSEQDPTPHTVFNELQAEFFQRVSESNRKFKRRNFEGWETDRGKIFILYGPPAKIENGRYSSHSLPYLVWEYDESLKFVFVDKRRNGEFFLVDTELKE
jgi:GWxTD domain-containing protein